MANFFELKMRALFDRFDLNNSGTLQEEDFEKWYERLNSYGHLAEDKSKDLRQNIMNIWSENFAKANKNDDDHVTFEEFIAYLADNNENPNRRAFIENTIPLIFDAINTNNDDHISTNEFSDYMKSINITDEKFIDQVFKTFDLSNDGKLSKEEFTNITRDFFLGEDESSPSKYIFGPLP